MLNALKITLAQLNPTVGDIDGNAQKMLDVWEHHQQDSDLILFPELFLCGYPPEDLVLNAAFQSEIEQKITSICETSKNYNCAALIPTIWVNEGQLYNAALLIEHGKIKNICNKHKLPNNSVFDEPRVFTAGKMPEPIDFRGTKLGVMICEDLWHEEIPIHLKKQGAELLISINASPFDKTKYNIRKNIALSCVNKTGLKLIYLNMVGGQDELVFDGRSFIMDAKGNLSYQAPAFETSVTQGKPEDSPKYRLNNCNELIYSALKLGLKDYVRKNGFKDVLLGLSGGIDSALVAAIAVDALGAEHVSCVMLPSEFTSDESLHDANTCAELLNVSCKTIPISDAVKVFENIVPNLSGLAHENTQSRIRGTILMAMSNISGALLLTTGNKSEVAVGYCTIYGDMNGAFNPLKDLYKTEVFALAKWRGLPDNIITKAPSAELRPDQKDQDSLPPYDLLDDILYQLIECDDSSEPSALADKYPDEIEKIARLMKNSEHKRFQSAPGTRITNRAFGKDRRYPITNHFVNKIAKAK